MSESDLEAVDSKRQSSHDKHRGERGVVVRVRRERERERERERRERRDEGTYATATLAYP
jgi:hypothetical protein